MTGPGGGVCAALHTGACVPAAHFRRAGALHRALELIDLTLDDPRHRISVARLREIARLREEVVDFFAGPNQYRSSAASLQKHLDAYAVAARRTVSR